MRVLIFGASSAQGFWDSQGGWADRLKHYYNDLQIKDFSIEQPKVMNLGVSGDSTAEVLKRIGPEAEARQNDKGIAIVIQVGSNNAAEVNSQTRSTTEHYKGELEDIVIKAKQLTDKILVVGFPAVNESLTNPVAWANLCYKNDNIAKFEAAAQQTAQKTGVDFVPVHSQFKADEMTAPDGLHPNDAGHQLIFELVQPALDKLLAQSILS